MDNGKKCSKKGLNEYDILIVDDEISILKMLTKTLSRKGYKIDTADNGTEAIKKAVTNNYGLIITDIKMPGISGEEVLHTLKKIKRVGTPFIGMSGTPWLLDGTLFDAVMEKPFSMKELFETVEKIVGQASKHVSDI